MTFKEYWNSTCRHYEKKEAALHRSYRMKDAYRWYRKRHKDEVTGTLFGAVVRAVNQRVADLMLKGQQFKIPHRMGRMELRKKSCNISYKNGKLRGGKVNWPETIKLWYDDEDAREKKTLIRYERTVKFLIYYNDFQCNCKNIKFYAMYTTRSLTQKINRGIVEDEIDALPLY